MGMALYRNHRPTNFSEVVGQEHVTRTLQNAIKTGRVSHAYLFTGPRGVGKTSVARILAHEVNKLPYSSEAVHLDIIEIDAASNRRIDEIRDLRDRVRVAPTSAKYKVYIIDEVHMLTKEAFNALLKTLEEPPAHCIFILATTEAHKLPETIVSRTQRFEFKSVGSTLSAQHLRKVARKEKIDIDDAALEILAEFGSGSFRDSLSYLDQLSSYGHKITKKDVRDMLGLPRGREIDSILALVEAGDSAGVLDKLTEMEKRGASPTVIASSLSNELRRMTIKNQATPNLIKLLKQLLDVSAHKNPRESLEIVLLSAAVENASPDVNAIEKNEPVRLEPAEDKKAVDLKNTNAKFEMDKWAEVVEKSKKQAASIYTALRLAKPEFGNGVLTLYFQFPFHQKKVNQTSCKDTISRLIKDVTGADVVVVAKLSDKNSNEDTSEKEEPMSAINSIFGKAELMET